MLLELNIENFAIIENMKIEFEPGLNVLTGETGSGKSIIIDSLGLVLGQRANKDIIKKGKDRAFIEAVFSSYDEETKDLLLEYGIESGDLVVVSKEIREKGPTITRVNNRTVTSQILSKISSHLIDIFAQHESISLMDNKNQLKLIDDFSGKDQEELLGNLKDLVHEINSLKNEYHEKSTMEQNKDREIDLLEYQIKEIEDAGLSDYDDEELYDDFNVLNNMTDTLIKLSEAKALINEGYDTSSLEDILDKVIANVVEVTRYNKDLKEVEENLEDIRFRISDIAKDIDRYVSSSEVDEERLQFLRERIDLVNNLKLKYGNNVKAINSFYEEISERLRFLQNFEDNLNKLLRQIEEKEAEAIVLAEKISQNRKKTSEILEKKVEEEINKLNIKDAKFKIEIKEKELSFDGIDKIEFLIAPNLGQDLMPMAKVASGGEMSRIMLGFKSIIAEKDNIPTLVFDEIDTGISGKTAQIVGNKIKEVSKDRQVIVISHLPQIVALADTHFAIKKDVVNNSTISTIDKLNYDERVNEVARLIGGMNVSEIAIETAKEMIGD
ncbi:MAG: DNA repair protein RecN [Peptoniphilus harei]|uniref:DNA repair protein RecN n=1 Tax=Peptoniphilus harei TaxID=54005 RepID=UPI00254F4CBC|nr:DNA repair protein RecN [Peptoniphilus harei]MDK7755428.1 DNA repair protein RecN [Peptoniphilus harei]MDK7761822.1 DNA repair protein RecN [Peptoniphilus harei]MDK8271590.1 DNA repair protein RecN [Peptoniphilus harei]MDK8339224.1 DNA repair protein RecN [Peptoniphilus harei]